jgi:hypothetical protein
LHGLVIVLHGFVTVSHHWRIVAWFRDGFVKGSLVSTASATVSYGFDVVSHGFATVPRQFLILFAGGLHDFVMFRMVPHPACQNDLSKSLGIVEFPIGAGAIESMF